MSLAVVCRILRRRAGYFGWLGATVALSTTLAAALWTITDGLLFRPLPFPHADRTVVLDFRQADGRLPELAYLPDREPERRLLRARVVESPLVEAFALHEFTQFFEPDVAAKQGVRAEGVSETFFSLFNLNPIVGRTFTASERNDARSIQGAALPVVISHHLWTRLYGGRPDVLGIRELAGHRVRVVGVLEAGAKFPGETNVWAPTPDARVAPPKFVRLASGVTAEDLAAAFPALTVGTLESFVRPATAGAVPMLLAASVLLLLTVLIQLMTLEVAETPERMRTAGIQLALGASFRDVLAIRALPVVLVVGVASTVGWIASGSMVQGVSSFLPPELTDGQYLKPDGRAGVVVAGLGALFLAILAVAPALVSRGTRPAELLRARLGGVQANSGGLRRSLVAAQVGASGLLLYLLGLAAHSYAQAATFNFGFEPTHVYIFTPPRPERMPRPPGSYTPEQVNEDWRQAAEFKAMIQQTVDHLSSHAQVAAAANVFAGPLGIGNSSFRLPPLTAVETVGQTGRREVSALGNAVGADFVDAMALTLVAGVGLDAATLRGRDDVALINETLARQLAPGIIVGKETIRSGFVGQRIRTVDGTHEVVGVVRDLLDSRLDIPNVPQYFVVDRQSRASAAVVVRMVPGASVDPHQFLPTVVEPIWGRVEPNRVAHLARSLDTVLVPYRGQAILLALIVACCLPIAGMGFAGAIAVVVRQRSKEFAIRSVLGADLRSLRGLLLRDALPSIATGLLLAVGAGFLIAKGTSHALFGVSPLDPVSVVIVVAGLGGVAGLAMLASLRRIARTASHEFLKEP